MKKALTLFALLIFNCAHAHASTVLLSCDLLMDVSARTPWHMDILVDFDAKRAAGLAADISDSTISFLKYDSSGEIVYTTISRISGSINITSNKLGTLATGSCVVAQGKKF